MAEPHHIDDATLSPPTPTDHPIGSWERVEELRRRYERGERLWSESDSRRWATIAQRKAAVASMLCNRRRRRKR